MNFLKSTAPSLRSDRRSKPVTEHAAAAVAAEDEHRAARRLPLRHRLRLARLVPRALLFGWGLGRGLWAHVGRVLGAWLGSGLGPVVSVRARVAASSGGCQGHWVGVRVGGLGRTVAADERDPTVLLARSAGQGDRRTQRAVARHARLENLHAEHAHL